MSLQTVLLPRIRFWAYVFATLLTIGLWTITLYQLHLVRLMHVQSTERNLLTVNRVLHAHATRTIQLADLAANVIKREFKQQGMGLDLNRLIQEKVLTEDSFNLFTIVGPDAHVALSTRPFERVNLADREHIKAHVNQDTGQLFVGKPVIGRVSGKASLQLTRRINQDDGSFGGVVVVSMDPFYFTDVYGSLGLNTNSVISLVRKDGLVLVRRTDKEQSIGVDVSDSPVFKKIISSDEPVFESWSPIDGVDRVWAFQELDNLPVFVAVGLDLDQELRPFYEMRTQIYLLASLLTVIIFGFTYAFLRFVGILNESRQSAISANRAKTEFLSNVSHELRTPLNGILGYTELLQVRETDPEKASFLNHIYQSGAHLLSLVSSLLALNRIEKGEIDLALKQEKLRPILQEVLDAHRQNANAKGLSLTLRIEPSTPDQVICDRVKLLQILHNLTQNAIKFTTKGYVHIVARTSGSRLEIAIEDTGCGISAEHQKTVFDRFFQSQGKEATEVEGFGIGLAIVKQLANLMQGDVSVQSTLGQGSIFTVRIPLRERGFTDTDTAVQKPSRRKKNRAEQT